MLGVHVSFLLFGSLFTVAGDINVIFDLYSVQYSNAFENNQNELSTFQINLMDSLLV